MNYYDELRSEVEQAVAKLAKQYTDLQKQVAATRKKIADERDSAERVQQHIDKLKSLAGESLAGGQNSYESFKASLRKRTLERDTALEIVETLKGEVLPRTQEALIHAQRKLEHALTALCQEKRRLPEQKMSELVGQIIAEHDAWLEAWERLFADYGVSFQRNRPENIPTAHHARLDRDRPGFPIIPLSMEQRAERLKKSQKQLTAV